MGIVVDILPYLAKKNKIDPEDFFIFFSEQHQIWIAENPETNQVLASAAHYEDLIDFLHIENLLQSRNMNGDIYENYYDAS